jgi:hypothetical protein
LARAWGLSPENGHLASSGMFTLQSGCCFLNIV